ncbi:MAG: hypothetical protein R3197_04350 [Paracoccaceae bacterium]|nr:hypothetical protein [Paracoccaceae bacterium]
MSTQLLLQISQHAAVHMAERGINKRFLAALMDHADVETPVGGGATALRVSRKRARLLNFDDRLHRYSVILSSDATVITVLPLKPGLPGRRYRRH